MCYVGSPSDASTKEMRQEDEISIIIIIVIIKTRDFSPIVLLCLWEQTNKQVGQTVKNAFSFPTFFYWQCNCSLLIFSPGVLFMFFQGSSFLLFQQLRDHGTL